jgi:hypothetical protein
MAKCRDIHEDLLCPAPRAGADAESPRAESESCVEAESGIVRRTPRLLPHGRS